jgi:hypothetical protein
MQLVSPHLSGIGIGSQDLPDLAPSSALFSKAANRLPRFHRAVPSTSLDERYTIFR